MNETEKYILVMGSKSYCEETNSFESGSEKATKYSTYTEANKKKNKLYKKIFGTISIKIVY